MPIGRIMRWDESRGFGFLSDDKQPGRKWAFAHISTIPGNLAPEIGDAFSYDLQPGRDGRERAVDLVPMTAAREEADRIFGRDDY